VVPLNATWYQYSEVITAKIDKDAKGLQSMMENGKRESRSFLRNRVPSLSFLFFHQEAP
jgi:hypothetical protein